MDNWSMEEEMFASGIAKGEIESPEQNGLYIFYYCTLDAEPELCFGDFKEAKGSKDIPLYNAILQLRERKWNKAKNLC